MPTTDLQLLDAWRQGDRLAGGKLLDRYFMPLRRFFRNKIGDEFEELVQRTLSRCLEAQHRFRGQGGFRSFLFGIAYNVLREHLREQRRDHARVELDASVVELGMPGPSTVAGLRREQRRLLAALRRIPLRDQVLLELFYWEQLSSTEIGAVLDMPKATVRGRLRVARELLRGHLDQLAREGGDLRTTTTDELDRWAAELRMEWEREGDRR